MEGSPRKRPHFICARERKPLALAGLWERWRGGGEIVESYTILTTSANEGMKQLHDRMPVVLRMGDVDRWLDPAICEAGGVADLLRPCAEQVLEMWEVGTAVNRPENEGKELVDRVVEDEGTSGGDGLLWGGSGRQ